MQDATNLSKESALEMENQSLKNVLKQCQAEAKALDQTLAEVLRANISLKAGCSLLENKISELESELKNHSDKKI